jgi:hypothetical protein
MEIKIPKKQHIEKTSDGDHFPVSLGRKDIFLRGLYALPGRDILNRILDMTDPREWVQRLSYQDFFWLLNKVGVNDALSLLELASIDQWQYILDLELWKKDRFDISQASLWLDLLQQADCKQLVRWLFTEGEYFSHYHFYRTLELIIISNKDEISELPEGFFSLDGLYYIRVKDLQYRESMENIIRTMAGEDINKYQALLLGLAGLLPAEVEEELYRLRNVRLAEQGFLPFEEAIAVYSPLEIDALKINEEPYLIDISKEDDIGTLVPVIPLDQAGAQNFLMDILGGINDPLLLDRLRLEFAGLTNQILSADGLLEHDTEILRKAGIRSARIVNLALDKLSGRDPVSALELLKRHPLITLFRVGYGMVLKVKWEVDRWLKESWFVRQGLNSEFWGDIWGGTLKGLLAKRPEYYIGSMEKEEYKDFEWLSELNNCLETLGMLMVLDSLLEKLTKSYTLKEDIIRSREITYYPLLFNLWARLFLKDEPSFEGISLPQARNLFSQLRAGQTESPFKMEGFKKRFIRDFMAYVSTSDTKAASILEEALSMIWMEFVEEYERVPIKDLERRYSRFITINTAL